MNNVTAAAENTNGDVIHIGGSIVSQNGNGNGIYVGKNITTNNGVAINIG